MCKLKKEVLEDQFHQKLMKVQQQRHLYEIDQKERI